MEKQLIHEMKIRKVKEMKKPVIYMNDKDFELLVEEIKLKVSGFKPSKNPTYQGIPIINRPFFAKGIIYFIDQASYTKY